MIQHYFTRQFLSFIAVGGFAALLHWLARIVLSLWMSFSMAVVLAYVVGMTVGFALNSRFVFPNSPRPKRAQAQAFVVVNLAFLPVVWAASLGLERLLRRLGMIDYVEAVAHGLAVAVPTLATFLIYKLIAFRDAQYGRK